MCKEHCRTALQNYIVEGRTAHFFAKNFNIAESLFSGRNRHGIRHSDENTNE